MASVGQIAQFAFSLGFLVPLLSAAEVVPVPLPPVEVRAAEPAPHSVSVDVQKLQPPILVPGLLESALSPISPGGKALQDAGQHVREGRFLVQENRLDAARREFDKAVDILLAVPEDIPDRAQFERLAEDIVRRIHKYDLESLGAGQAPDGLFFTQSPRDEVLDLTFPVDPRMRGRVIESVRASSSELPLDVNDAVLGYINFFSSPRGQRIFTYGWKRAGRYRAMIERVFREEGLPLELIHLAQAESGFMPRALSVKACAGMWQFARRTGDLYGLEAGKQQDDRLDPEKATRAAARHLHDLYRQTGDWYLAMAGYDCGALCVERAVQRTGYADYWELRRRNAIPKETRNYVPAILAMAIIAKDPAAYGIQPVDQDPELEFDTIRVTAPTHLGLIADAADTPVSDLRDLNPSVLKNLAPTGTEVRIPKGRAHVVLAALETVPADKRTSWRLHRVCAGDTLPQICHRYGATPAAVLAANRNLGAEWFDHPHEGEWVLIPLAPRPAVAPVKTARRNSTSKSGARPASASASSKSSTSAAVRRKPHPATATKPTAHHTQVASAAHPAAGKTASR